MKCPGCQADVDPEQDFCMDCGEPIAGVIPPGAKSAATAPAAPAAHAPVAAPAAASPAKAPVAPAAKKPAWKRRPSDDEPEPVRCPGCGAKSSAARCPGCGVPLRRDED